MTEEKQGPAAHPPGESQKPRGIELAKPADVPQPPQTQTQPRRRHRRLSNVRRLLRALGIIDWLIVTSFAAQAQAPNSANRQQFMHNLVAAAIERTHHEVTYDPGYVVIGYPGGDVPANSGVCSDEIIPVYRAVGIDLQKKVYEDIARDSSTYPLNVALEADASRSQHRPSPRGQPDGFLRPQGRAASRCLSRC